ncbi:hypothetical protein JR316_0012296 [Psilocybe cubensis]|uniref:F-box domain-containing protein n=2 Tax=Psilocybe cubensis TaxID=181762 RepID=A0A8H7XNY5_PSICU|nr:hypothetical protein JR316_0012296 [Psilocybe cubensis]KAH9475185.1 hypothetical protein JR316_0012296 [Psilocybe cubensis]
MASNLSEPTSNKPLPLNATQTDSDQCDEDPNTVPIMSTMTDFLPRLPADISSLIFFYTCQPYPDPFLDLDSNPRWERQLHPLKLGQVSRSWRGFVWGSSEIWQTIIVKVRGPNERIISQVNLLKEWISRAKGRPLDIYLEENECDSSSLTIDPVDLLLTLLVRHAHQWRTIKFHLSKKRYQFISLLGTKTNTRKDRMRRLGQSNASSRNDALHSEERVIPLDNLQTASLHGTGKNDDWRANLPLDLSQAPLLRELTFSSIIMKSDMFLNLSTKGITQLTLSFVLRIVPRELLDQLPNLTELTLSKCSVVRKLEFNAASRPIIHERLRVFNIEVESDFLFNLLVHQLCFPALEKIYIIIPEVFQHTKFLLPFIRRSGCILTSLTTESMCNTEDCDLIEFLSADVISPLKELHILDYDTMGIVKKRKKIIRRNKVQGAFSGLNDAFFVYFHPYLFPDFLPRLEVLEYRGMLSVDDIDFLEPFMLRSRMRDLDSGNATDGDPRHDISILKRVRIQAEKAAGMSFSIAEYHDPQYVWELIRMVEVGFITLLDSDGMVWE